MVPWLSLVVSVLALISTWVFNLATLRRAKHGPIRPRWQLKRGEAKCEYLLINDGMGVARNVDLEVVPSYRMELQTSFDHVGAGAARRLLIIVPEESPHPVVRVTWARPWWRPGREEWISDLP
jgi:hypothetical protein